MHAIVALLLFALLAVWEMPAQAAPLKCPEDAEGGACVWGRVEGFDGASLQVRGLSVRLVGIAVPAARDLCLNKTTKEEFPCLRLAKKRMGELVGKGVACEILDLGGDALWGRCRGGEGDLAHLLVQSGVARAAKDGPLETDQAQAMTAKKGLWAADIQPPKEWDAARKRADRD